MEEEWAGPRRGRGLLPPAVQLLLTPPTSPTCFLVTTCSADTHLRGTKSETQKEKEAAASHRGGLDNTRGGDTSQESLPWSRFSPARSLKRSLSRFGGADVSSRF